MTTSRIPDIKPFKDFSAVVPYKAITNDVIVSENPDQLTAILELHISSINDTDIMQGQHDRLMRLLCELPDKATVSIYFTKTFNDEAIPYIGDHKTSVVNYIEEKRIKRLTLIEAPTYACFLSVTLPFATKEDNDFSLLNKVLSDGEAGKSTNNDIHYKRTLDKLNYSIKTIVAALDGRGVIYRLSSSQIIKFLAVLINHEFQDVHSHISTIFKSDFYSSVRGAFSKKPAYVYYGGHYHAVLSLRNAQKDSKLPETSDASLNNIFLHKDLANIPFTIHHAINFPSKSEGLRRATIRKNMITARGALATYLPFLAKTPEGIQPEILKGLIEESIELVRNSTNRFLEQHFHIHLWAKTLEEMYERCETFDAAISSVYKLKRDKLNIKPAFFSICPGNEHVNSIKNTLPSFNVADFMPIDTPRFCYPAKSKDFIYYHSMVNSLVRLSIFDKRADNWNALVVGGSGSGKSFLTQDILWQYSVYKPQIAIVDYGGAEAGSYRSFVMNNQGTYLEIGFGTNAQEFSINPFDGPLFNETERPDADKMVSLFRTIELMVCNQKGDKLSNLALFELQNSLKAYYTARDNNSNNSCSLNDFAQNFLKGNVAILAAGRDLFKELFFFIGEGAEEGPYARFFKATQEFKTTDVICFDLEGLKGHERLRNVLVAALLDMITNRILTSSEKERKKLMIMDEAWKDLSGGDLADFMQNCSRTIRKLNGQIIIISQRLSDILDSPIGGAILANTSYYYLVGNKHEHNPQNGHTPLLQISASSNQGTQRLSEYDIETILNQQSKRDFYLLTPFFCGQLRFYPSQEFCMVATTDPEDKNVLRRHMEKVGHTYVTPEVMESARHEFFKK